MADFNIAVQHTLAEEGGYAVNKKTGEVVNMGITAAWLRAHRFPYALADVQALTIPQVTGWYLEFFWDNASLSETSDQRLASKIFDLRVNMGLVPAVRLLQQACNQLPTSPPLQKLAVDGVCGPDTIAACNAEDPAALLAAFKLLAEARYRMLAANDPDLADDLPGWLARLAKDAPPAGVGDAPPAGVQS